MTHRLCIRRHRGMVGGTPGILTLQYTARADIVLGITLRGGHTVVQHPIPRPTAPGSTTSLGAAARILLCPFEGTLDDSHGIGSVLESNRGFYLPNADPTPLNYEGRAQGKGHGIGVFGGLTRM